MRKEKALVRLLQRLVELVAEEAGRNPEFSSKLEDILSVLPDQQAAIAKGRTRQASESLPDVYAEWNARGEAAFRDWLGAQPISVVHELIRRQDMDPTRRTAKWKDAEKLADFVTEGLRARLARGSAFLGPTSTRRRP